jgi:serine protease Do
MHMHDHDMGPKEPVTFLGVETSDVPRVLSEQIGLPRGFGVVVDYVAKDSPAAAAGLQTSDIIKMLNDQIIINPDQLGKLVRSFADGATVNLTVLRKNQEVKLTVSLKKHDVSVGRGPFGGFEGFEKEWNFDDLDKMNFDFQAPDMTAVRDAVKRAKDEAMRAGDEARKAVRKLRIVTTDDDMTKTTKVDLGNATVSFSDDEGELKIERVNGKKMLSARDNKGNVLFDGPIDTEEQRSKVPQNVRERFELLENQDLPEVPPAPETPKANDDDDDDGNESVKLENRRYERAALSPELRTGWVRSTVLL